MATPDLVLEPAEIVTGRYRLAAPSLRDAGDLLAMAQDPELQLWNQLTGVTDEESARAWCERWSDWDGGGSAQWVVLDALEGKFLGTISLFQIDMRNLSAETGYRVAPWARGHGVATAALTSATEWAFETLGLTRVQLMHALENPASCRVAAKSGFVLEGELRSSYRYGDEQLHDEYLHARLAGDPAARRAVQPT
jgi:RimJ/RimL family protein N-acetyltransferase